MSPTDQPQDSSRDGAADTENVTTALTVTVHRAPRYRNFMLLGAVAGVLLALVLTVSFPENDEYARTQIFGFLLLGGLALGTTLGGVVALVIDRVIGRSPRSVVADRLSSTEPRAAEPGSGASNEDFPAINEK